MVCTIGLSARAATGDKAIAHSTLAASARSRLVVMESPRLRGGARGAVEGERGRLGGVAGVGGLEADTDRAARSDRRVVADISCGDRAGGRCVRGVPAGGDGLSTREGEGEGPAV